MLYKKELADIPVGKMPAIKMEREFVATSQIVKLNRSGEILVVDFFRRKDKSHSCRFVTDGKGYLTQAGKTGVWTEQNPRATYGYGSCAATPEDVKTAAEFLNKKVCTYDTLLGLVDDFITHLRWDRRQKAEDRREELRKKHFSMYPPHPDNLQSCCEDHLFDAYIFISQLDKKGHRPARCSHCGKEFEAPKAARSGQRTSCPACGKSATYRATWIKGAVENKTKICIPARVDGQLLLRWTEARRRFIYPDFKAEYYFEDYAYNLFLHTPNKGEQVYSYKWQMCGYYYGGWDWYRGRIGDLCYDSAAVYTDNLTEVFGERYCGVDLGQTLVQTHGKIPFAVFLDNLKNIPATEYLLKMGMVNLASAVRSIDGAMNCKRPTFANVLGVDAQFAKMYSEMDVTLTEHHIIKTYGKWISPEQLEMFRALDIPAHESGRVRDLLAEMSFSRFVHYFHKQARLNPKRTITQILICYKEYISMSGELGVDLSHKGIRFPKNCVEAHDQILPRFNSKKQEAEDNKFVEAVKSVYAALRLTAFEKDGFCIVFPQKRSDLTTEGQSLNHCVGGQRYANNHMAGTRLIFFVREIQSRGKPFFTMEVDMESYRICQLYGFGDCSAPPEVRKFAEAFVKKLTPAGAAKKTA